MPVYAITLFCERYLVSSNQGNMKYPNTIYVELESNEIRRHFSRNGAEPPEC